MHRQRKVRCHNLCVPLESVYEMGDRTGGGDERTIKHRLIAGWS